VNIEDIKFDLQIALTADSAGKIAEYMGYSATDPVGDPDDPSADPGMNPETVSAFLERELKAFIMDKYRKILADIYAVEAEIEASRLLKSTAQTVGKEIKEIKITASPT